jgi:hypothetical protein
LVAIAQQKGLPPGKFCIVGYTADKIDALIAIDPPTTLYKALSLAHVAHNREIAWSH